MSIFEVFVNVTGIFTILSPLFTVREERSQFIMALAFRSHSFPKIRTSSCDSKTWNEVGRLIFPIVIGKLFTIPSDLVRAPFAVMTMSLDGLSTSNPSRVNRVLVMMLVAAALSTMAVCIFPFTLRVTLAAVVVSSSSLPIKLASLSLL